MRKIKLLLALIITSQLLVAQKEYNTWCFGYGNTGINFNTNPPTATTVSLVNVDDNTAAISDPVTGSLIFYASGTTAYTRTNTIMPNGSGLNGSPSGGHTATIVQKPGSSNLYYLFTMTNEAGPNGVQYSIIDMTLNGGLGDVTAQKNMVLRTPVTEKIVPILHKNGTDIWILIHDWGNNAYMAYLLNSAGISASPVISNIGAVHGGSPYNALGQITVNRTNTRIASSIFSDGVLEILDFDNQTGVLSNPISISLNNVWGCEFSADGSKLYTTQWTMSNVYQYDLSNYTSLIINNSKTLVGNCTPSSGYSEGYMALAPDDKIYIAKYQQHFLATISNPNNLGTACNFADNGFNLGTGVSSAGLVDKTIVHLSCPPLAIHLGNDTSICFGQTLNLIDTNANTTHLWNTGATNANITVSTAGTYWVQTKQGVCTYSDTIVVSLKPTPVVHLGNDTGICKPDSVVLNAFQPFTTFLWQDGSTKPTFVVKNTGTYWVQVSNGICTTKDSIVITTNRSPVVHLGNDTSICFGQTLNLIDTNANTTHLWNTGATNANITVSTAGTYWVQTKQGVCTYSDTIVVSLKPTPVVHLGNDTGICKPDSVVLNAFQPFTTFLWQDGSTKPTYIVKNTGTYWVQVSNGLCTTQDSIQVVVNSNLPMINLGADTTICEREFIWIHASCAGCSYHWSTGSQDSTLQASTAGVYSVTVTNGCGTASDSKMLTTKPCVCLLDFPTAFSPNGDSKNETFGAVYSCPIQHYELHIYNRWGELLFTTQQIDSRWDGTYKGTPQPMEVYIYMATYTDPFKQHAISKSGNVTLVR